MTGIRIEGSEADIQEVLKRFEYILPISRVAPKLYPSRQDPNIKFCYLRLYINDRDKYDLHSRFLSMQDDIQKYQTEQVELLAKIRELERQLGVLPHPKPYDAVLGGNQTNLKLIVDNTNEIPF